MVAYYHQVVVIFAKHKPYPGLQKEQTQYKEIICKSILFCLLKVSSTSFETEIDKWNIKNNKALNRNVSLGKRIDGQTDRRTDIKSDIHTCIVTYKIKPMKLYRDLVSNVLSVTNDLSV